MSRLTLYGSPHSLPTYKVASMLRLSHEPFSFRYVSFRRDEHKAPEFLALSRWGQVPVLVEDGHVRLQATAIIEHLAETLGRFQGSDPTARQLVREWLYWEVDALFPPIFSGYGVHMGRRGLLPISVSPQIAEYHQRRAEAALTILDGHLAHGGFLCDSGPTIADIACCCDVVFAGMTEIDTTRWKNVTSWATADRGASRFRTGLGDVADGERRVHRPGKAGTRLRRSTRRPFPTGTASAP